MTRSQKPMHPRKLYTKLRDCADAQARASAVLDFMVESTGAREGFVLLARQGELVVAANSNAQEPCAQLIERAHKLWASESDAQSENDMTRTMDARQLGSALVESMQWQAANGQSHEPRVLGFYKGSEWCPLGIAVLASSPAGLRPIRHAHIEAVCNALLDAGDVAGA